MLQKKFKKDVDVVNFVKSERKKNVPGITYGSEAYQSKFHRPLLKILSNIFFHHHFKNPKHYQVIYGEQKNLRNL